VTAEDLEPMVPDGGAFATVDDQARAAADALRRARVGEPPPLGGRPFGAFGRLRVIGLALVLIAVVGAAVAIGTGAGRGSAPAHPPRPQTSSVAVPPCFSPVTATGKPLASASPSFTSVDGQAFDVQVTPDGRWSFVMVGSASGRSSVEVFSDLTTPPTFVRSIGLPGSGFGESVSADGRYLVVATGDGAAVIDVGRAVAGQPGALMGVLSELSVPAWLVAVSPDDRYVFVTHNGSVGVDVYDLARALTGGFGPTDFLGIEPITGAEGLAISPDGHRLYVTDYPDTLVVVDLDKPGPTGSGIPFALGLSVPAGCFPNRVITSSDGRDVWVGSSYDDEVLGYSAAALLSDPAHALIARVRVGANPVGLALVDQGRLLVVADGDWSQFLPGYPAADKGTSDLTVVSVAAALDGKPAVVGTIASGEYPRGVVAEADNNTVLVANSESANLEAVTLRS